MGGPDASQHAPASSLGLVPTSIHLIDERHDLGQVLTGLGGFWQVVPGRPADGSAPGGVVLLAPAPGTDPSVARTRAAATARRHGWPVVLICDGLALPARELDPGVDVLPHAGLTAAALARTLRHARARTEAQPMTPLGATALVGLVVQASLQGLQSRLAGAGASAVELRRHAMGDPRGARHAEAITWSLRETAAAISTALAADTDPDSPLPAHTLASVADPLLRAALGSGVRLSCTDTAAPLRLAPGAAVDLMIHAAVDLLPIHGHEGGQPALQVVVTGDDRTLTIRLVPMDAASPEQPRRISAATLAAASQCDAAVVPDGDGLAIRIPLPPNQDPRGSGPGILLVDDHPEVAAAISATLAEAGIDTTIAGTAEQALEQLARNPGIAVVVSDLALPGMDGLALARRLRAVGCTAKVLLITGFADERTDAALAEGLVTAVIDKPFRPAHLVQGVRSALRP